MAGEITATNISMASVVLYRYLRVNTSKDKTIDGVNCDVYLAQEMGKLGIDRAGTPVKKPIELFKDAIYAYLDKSLTGSSASSASGSPKQTRARVSVETLRNFIALRRYQNGFKIRLIPDMLYYMQYEFRVGEIIAVLVAFGRELDSATQVFVQGYQRRSTTIRELPKSGRLQYEKNHQLLLSAIRQFRNKLLADNPLAKRIDEIMSRGVPLRMSKGVPRKRKPGAKRGTKSSATPNTAQAAAAPKLPRRSYHRTAQVTREDRVLNAIERALEQLSVFNDFIAGKQAKTAGFMEDFYGGIKHILNVNGIRIVDGDLLKDAYIVLGAIASTCIEAVEAGHALSLSESCIITIFSLSTTHPSLRILKCSVMNSVMAIFDKGGQPACQMAKVLFSAHHCLHEAFLCGTFWEDGGGAASGSTSVQKARDLYQSNIAIWVRKILEWADGLGADPLAQHIRFFFAKMGQSQRLSATVARVVQPAAPARAQVLATDVVRAAAEFVEAGGQAAVAGVVRAAAGVASARAPIPAAGVVQAQSTAPSGALVWRVPDFVNAQLVPDHGSSSSGLPPDMVLDPQDNPDLSYEAIAKLADYPEFGGPGFF